MDLTGMWTMTNHCCSELREPPVAPKTPGGPRTSVTGFKSGNVGSGALEAPESGPEKGEVRAKGAGKGLK